MLTTKAYKKIDLKNIIGNTPLAKIIFYLKKKKESYTQSSKILI